MRWGVQVAETEQSHVADLPPHDETNDLVVTLAVQSYIGARRRKIIIVSEQPAKAAQLLLNSPAFNCNLLPGKQETGGGQEGLAVGV